VPNPSFFGSLSPAEWPISGMVRWDWWVIAAPVVAIVAQYAHDFLRLVCISARRILSTYNRKGSREK